MFFFFKQKTAYEIMPSLVGSEMCIRDSRYSVDDRWFVPHFEKMLYDQAQIAVSYLEAFQATGDRQYAEAARRILDYVLRDMTDAGGGFYSAEDADSAIALEHPGLKGE